MARRSGKHPESQVLLFAEASGPRPRKARENPVTSCLRGMAAMYSEKYLAPLSISWKRDASMAARTAREWGQAARSAGMTPEALLVSAWGAFLADPYHERSRHALPVFWRHRQRYLVEALDRARGIELQKHGAHRGPDSWLQSRPSWIR